MDQKDQPNQLQDQKQSESTPKQSVVARVQQANNVLVTVKSNPSVDELAATIGMTLMLNKLGKHATAVFSGEVPSTLEFLKPEETLETNTDSLRDFIVSLDKAKADKLRYKVEENVVRIYITPYRTSITQEDLEFTQGDFNVDVVLALGVTQREELDQAIMNHGRILHDATVITVTAGQDYSELGNINWQEAGASSLSEMLVSISEAFQGGLIDEQIATAFLTGIVSETERFSNPKTSPKVMTMAAQLMAAGANQQLIANELEKAVEVNLEAPAPLDAAPANSIPSSDDGSLSISHDTTETSAPTEPELPEPVVQEALPPLAPPSELDAAKILSDLPLPPSGPETTDMFVQSPDLSRPPEPPTAHAEPGSNIHIDTDGNLMRKVAMSPKHKVIEPLKSPEPETPAPNAQLGQVLPPASMAEPALPPLAPTFGDIPAPDANMSGSPNSADGSSPNSDMANLSSLPDLSHIPGPDTDTSHLPPVPNLGEAPAAVKSPLPPLPPLDLTPSGPIQDNTTLAEIEESVHSPHLQTTPPEGGGLDTARDAVNSAINAGDFSPAGQARADLNAMPLSTPPPATPYDSYRLDTALPTSPQPVTDVSGNLPPELTPPEPEQQPTNQLPPPPVPPPMLPR